VLIQLSYDGKRYYTKIQEILADGIYRLREEKQKIQEENAGRDEQKKRIADMSTFLLEQPTALTEYDEPLVRRLIEKVTVYEDKFTVEFKSDAATHLT
jgi:site-specific DNA recombinase